MKMFNERVFNKLDDKIKSVNSLIFTIYFDTQLDFREERIIKLISWQNAFIALKKLALLFVAS